MELLSSNLESTTSRVMGQNVQRCGQWTAHTFRDNTTRSDTSAYDPKEASFPSNGRRRRFHSIAAEAQVQPASARQRSTKKTPSISDSSPYFPVEDTLPSPVNISSRSPSESSSVPPSSSPSSTSNDFAEFNASHRPPILLARARALYVPIIQSGVHATLPRKGRVEIHDTWCAR
ncbi:hypothetical protein ARMGADRAFT_191996 [Armillaria gallica]|uniref:Uncharacterized protein n=1 Tax=Armillaria gallica TaxID=47427 RepID=A0A2H3DK83_ARMGA|nr:hypothetical protein ARMGADRAFT_191996 [Armillaria gallica]